MTTQQSSVKKYVVKLSAEERARLNAMIHKGKHPAWRVTQARILLKADVSEAGEGWSDSQIATALETTVRTVQPNPPVSGGGGVRGRADPQTLARLGQTTHLRRRRRGQIDRPGLLETSQGARAMDAAIAGNRGRGAEHRRSCQRQHDRADAKKTNSSLISRSNGSSRRTPMPRS